MKSHCSKRCTQKTRMRLGTAETQNRKKVTEIEWVWEHERNRETEGRWKDINGQAKGSRKFISLSFCGCIRARFMAGWGRLMQTAVWHNLTLRDRKQNFWPQGWLLKWQNSVCFSESGALIGYAEVLASNSSIPRLQTPYDNHTLLHELLIKGQTKGRVHVYIQQTYADEQSFFTHIYSYTERFNKLSCSAGTCSWGHRTCPSTFTASHTNTHSNLLKMPLQRINTSNTSIGWRIYANVKPFNWRKWSVSNAELSVSAPH